MIWRRASRTRPLPPAVGLALLTALFGFQAGGLDDRPPFCIVGIALFG